MSDSDQSDETLAAYLRLRGYSDDDVQKIVQQLAEHDSDTARQSVFDSIEAGTFNLDLIIAQALQSDEETVDEADEPSND